MAPTENMEHKHVDGKERLRAAIKLQIVQALHGAPRVNAPDVQHAIDQMTARIADQPQHMHAVMIKDLSDVLAGKYSWLDGHLAAGYSVHEPPPHTVWNKIG